jgi:hypothetical protein
MAAGLGYKEFTTGDVLTAADANGYLASQVVMVFADAAARTAAITTPEEGMISFLKDTNATEYYSGAAWLAVGAVSGGGMTLISTTSLSGASVTLGSIVGTYKHLLLLVTSATNATGNGYFTIDPNAAGNLVDSGQVEAGTSDTVGGDSTGADKIRVNHNTAMKNTSTRNFTSLWIYDYSSTSLTKPYSGSYSYEAGSNSTIRAGLIGGGITTTSAITSLVLANSGGSFNGGTALLYGVS